MVGMVGCFGWLDCSLPMWLVYFSLISIFAFAQIPQDKDGAVRLYDRIVYMLISGIIYVLIMAALLQWYMNYMGIDTSTRELFREGLKYVPAIKGIQGRYLLPFWPCLTLTICGIVPNKSNKLILWQCCYYVLLAIVPIYQLTYRYWL